MEEEQQIRTKAWPAWLSHQAHALFTILSEQLRHNNCLWLGNLMNWKERPPGAISKMLGQPQVNMRNSNDTLVIEFILVGFSLPPQLCYMLFTVFLLIYVITLIANMLIMMTI
ncbi:hypothetical protein Y1Q_0009434 [Alligator mississippiensis]|uniref:Uncharacterized protein n=1 Tax=Alligator mississippiensis TaxID=8496 RepID=A0A151NVE3_ALLMI|nr:hypothetical protein Y1Q_0009434 [Alligator mississippiensis]